MALYKCTITVREQTSEALPPHAQLICYKEKNSNKAAYAWAEAEGVEVFGEGVLFRILIEEDKPVV